MKVLITGGAGFIGRHLATHLTDHDLAVTVIDNESLGDRKHLDPTGCASSPATCATPTTCARR